MGDDDDMKCPECAELTGPAYGCAMRALTDCGITMDDDMVWDQAAFECVFPVCGNEYMAKDSCELEKCPDDNDHCYQCTAQQKTYEACFKSTDGCMGSELAEFAGCMAANCSDDSDDDSS